MQLEAGGQGQHALGQVPQPLQADGGIDGMVPARAPIGRPVDLAGGADTRLGMGRYDQALVQRSAIPVLQLPYLLGIDQTLFLQTFHIPLAQGGMFANGAIHERLGNGGFVGLVVTLAPVAHHVDDHVLAEGHAEIQRQSRHEHHRLGIVAVHVEDGRLHHLGHVRAIEGGAGIHRIAGREADLVVDDDMHRAAGAVAPGLGHAEIFHHHALAGEGRVTMQQDRDHAVAATVAGTLLAGAHRALHHRPDDLQVGRIEGQGQVHGAAGRSGVGGKTHVVFHVAGTGLLAQLVLALEFLEQVAGLLAQGVDEHIEAAAMGHADDHVGDAIGAAMQDQFIEQGYEGIGPLEGKTLLAQVAGVQVALQALGGGEPFEDMTLLLRIEPGSPPAPSRRCWIQRFWSVSVMCMYSAPMVPV
jgi:hypothetical protein